MSFAVFILYILCAYLRPAELLPSLAEYRTVLWIGLFALGLGFVTLLFRGLEPMLQLPVLALTSLTVVIALSRVAQGWLGGGLQAIVGFSTAGIMFFLSVLNVFSLDRLRIATISLVACVFLLAVGGVAAYHFEFMQETLILQQSGEERSDDSSEEVSRLSRVKSLGFLNDPNDFGQAIVMTLPLLTLAWKRERRTRNLFLVILPATLMLYCLYLTHSRGAVLGLLVVCFFAIRTRIRPVLAIVSTVILGTGLLAFGISGGRSFSSKEQSASQRIDAWGDGLQMLREQPVFGVGYSGFVDHHEITAHNSFVLCFAELGLVGYFFWLWLLWMSWTDLSAIEVSATEQKLARIVRWANTLKWCLAGFLTCACFLSRTYIPTLYLLVGLITAFVYVVRMEIPVRRVPLRRSVGMTVVIEFATIAVVYVVIRVQHFL
jgi:putative inorganic carbon (HCO3(-)) transporter